MARMKRVSKARKGSIRGKGSIRRKGKGKRVRRVQSKRMGKKRTKRSSKSSSRSNKRMRRSFIKKSRGRPRRSLRRMRGGASGKSEAEKRFELRVGTNGIHRWMDKEWSKVTQRSEYYNIENLGGDEEAWTEAGLRKIQGLISDIYTSVGGSFESLPRGDKQKVYQLYKNTGLIHFNPEASQ